MRRWLPVAALLSAAVGGCCLSEPPGSREIALQRVNDNLSRIATERVPLYGQGLVSFRFRDDEGRVHRIPPTEARLIFYPERSLLFDVRHGLAATVAQFGSNDVRYWLWIAHDVQRLWYGDWAQANAPTTRRLVIPPNELLDALMLHPLPARLGDGPPPVLMVRGWTHILGYSRRGANGEILGRREVRVDPCPPHQPVEVTDYLADGRVAMHVRLRGWWRVGADGPYTARSYVVTWPLDDAELRLDIHSAKFRPDLADQVEDIFAFPSGWKGDMESLDASPLLVPSDSSDGGTP